MFLVLGKNYLKKLKNIFKCKWLYFSFFLFVIFYSVIYINNHSISKYSINDSYFEGKIVDIYIDGNYLSMIIKGKEKLQTVYYFETYEEKLNFINSYKLGDIISLRGTLSIPLVNTNPNAFNYKKYLYYENIDYILKIDSYNKLKENNNLFYKIKNLIINRINSIPKSKAYLHALILGDDRYISNNIIRIYQDVGISHLLAISGMHIGLFSGLLLFVLKKLNLKDKTRYLITIFFLLLYAFLASFSPSVSRAVTFFILLTLNKLLKLEIKTTYIYLLTILVLIIINPFIIFKVGFQFSSITSLGLILYGDLINDKKNYFSKLFLTSLISFLISMPICLIYFYQVNILSIIYNLIFVPFMSFILFPLSILAFMVPKLDIVLYFVIGIFENLANLFSVIPGVLIYKKLNILIYITYFVLVFIILKYRNKIVIVCFILILGMHYCWNGIFTKSYLLALDVGQGDSVLLHSSGKSILIDTGGKVNYSIEGWSTRENKNDMANNFIVPVLKSFGIKKINYLILTHGDFDHMGEAINLVNNFKVEKVIFNCGELNELEQNLIKVLDKKKIPYYSCIKELNIDDNKLYFLNNKDYGNENNNSSVIYTELNNHKFLFMGDAGVEVEEDLIEKYNLQDIDVLKVGHHGSKTSSGKEFIDVINPKYSIISVGENNRYGHPNREVLNNLNDSKIYRTDQDGSIMFKIKNDKFKIETCVP